MPENNDQPQENRLSVAQIVPSQLLDELLYIRDQATFMYWRIGDIANEVYALSIANNLGITKLIVCSAIAHLVGKSGRTVRQYAAMSAFFGQEIRERYQILAHGHFAFAMQFPGSNEEGQEIWQVILDTAIDYAEKHNAPPSLDALQGIYYKHIKQLSDAYQGNVPRLNQPRDDHQEDPLPEEYVAFDPSPSPQEELLRAYTTIQRNTEGLLAAVSWIEHLEKATQMPDVLRIKLSRTAISAKELLEELEAMRNDVRTIYGNFAN